MSKTEIKMDDIVLLQNNKRFDRKGVKFSQKWLVPYTVMNISDKGVATLKDASRVTFQNKCNIVQRKHYIQGADNKSNSTSKEKFAHFWNHAPDEIVEVILLYAVQQSKNSYSGHKREAYTSIESTCWKRARITERKVPASLLKIYTDT